MDEAITEFTHQLGSEGVAVFYFSGQGVQVHGADYMLPVDARVRRESDLADQAIQLDGLLDRLGEVGNRLNFIILDASRQNPFSRSGRTSPPVPSNDTEAIWHADRLRHGSGYGGGGRRRA